jgi:hypothetical protein
MNLHGPGPGLALDHPIFKTPHEAEFAWTEVPPGPHYADKTSVLYPDGNG